MRKIRKKNMFSQNVTVKNVKDFFFSNNCIVTQITNRYISNVYRYRLKYCFIYNKYVKIFLKIEFEQLKSHSGISTFRSSERKINYISSQRKIGERCIFSLRK